MSEVVLEKGEQKLLETKQKTIATLATSINEASNTDHPNELKFQSTN